MPGHGGAGGDSPAVPQRLPAQDWHTVLVFDGRGGVRRLSDQEEGAFVVPPRGFALISGRLGSAEFREWLKLEVGEFNADILVSSTTRTRCTVLEDKALVVLRVARPNSDPEQVGRQLLSLMIEKHRVIVASELNVAELLGVAKWEQSRQAPVSPADLVARLGLRAADRLEPLIEHMGDSLDNIEEALMAGKRADIRAGLAEQRRALITFRRLIWPQRDVLNTLEIEDLSFLSARDRVRLREAASRTARLGEELQALSERAVLVHEQILDARSDQMNRTMLILTAVTVVFMPLTVISGALGMNVAGIPFADSPYAFWAVLAILAGLGGAIAIWMRSRKWL